MSYADLLTQRATLQEATITRSTTGEELETWATRFTHVPVLARFLTPEADVPIGLAEAVTHLIHMEVLEDVRVGRWRAIIDDRSYRFVDIRDPGHRGHHFEILARKLEEIV